MYFVTFAVINPQANKKYGNFLVEVYATNAQEAAIKGIYASGLYEDYLSEWVNELAAKGLIPSETNLIDQMKEYAMIGVFDDSKTEDLLHY